MIHKIQKFISLFAHGVIYGAAMNATGGDVYLGGALY